MKFFQRKMRVPWDTLIFAVVTLVALAFSIERIVHPESPPSVQPPANLGGGESTVNSKDGNDAHVLDLGCLELLKPGGNKQLASFGGLLRIQGKFCELTKAHLNEIEQVEVKNLSNGYEGTIFLQEPNGTAGIPSEKAFSTDYLVLQTGKNLIQVRWKNKDSNKSQEIRAEVFHR